MSFSQSQQGTNRSSRPIVRPISQISLELVGPTAFDFTVTQCVEWLAERARVPVPDTAYAGIPFDLADADGPHWAAATRVDGQDASVWAARLDFHDRRVPQRTWLTELSIGNRGDLSRFGARLTNVTRGEDQPFIRSIPAVVQRLAEKKLAKLDGRLIGVRAETIRQPNEDYLNFIDFLTDQGRQSSVVVISQTDTGESVFDADSLAKRLCGAAHVFEISSAVARQLTRDFGRDFSVFNGAARHYKPRLDLDNSDPFDHELILRRPGSNPTRVRERLIHSVLDGTFTSAGADTQALRFERVRRAALDKEDREKRAAAPSSASLQDAAFAKRLEELEQQASEDAAAFQQLLDEAAAKKDEAEAKLSASRDHVAKLRARINWLEHALAQRGTETTVELESYADISEWVDKNLAGSVVVLPRAIRETEKHGEFRDIHLFSDALLLLKNSYVPMRRDSATMSRAQFDEICKELHLEESACFAQANDIKAFNEYWVPYGGGKRACDRHLKCGGGTDPRSMFRIYFFWDEDEEMVVVGHMPTHLPNWKTN